MSAILPATRARLQWLCVALAVLAGLAGCTLKSGGYNTTSPPKIRFFNAAFDVGTVDVDIGSIQTLNALQFETFATYRTASLGSQPVTIIPTGTTTPILATPVAFDNGQRWAYILYGRPASPQALVVADNVDLPGGGKYKLRLINAATESGPLDIYVTSPGDSLETATPTIAGVTLGSVSDFVELNSQSIEVRIVPSGTKSVFYDSGQITLSERNAYSYVAYNRGDPAQVNAALLTHDTLGSSGLQNSTVGKVRVINASPGTPALNVTVDGTPLVTNVAYATASPYAVTAAGAHTATVQATSAPATTVLTGSVLFPPGGDATFVVFGTPTATVAITLQDANFAPQNPANARVRVVNAGTGVGAITTFVDGTLTVGTLGNATTSLYFELSAGTHAISFLDPTSTATLLQVRPAPTLAAGHTYTLLLIGTADALSYLLIQDR